MKNIVLIGMMGCGKSTIGKILSEKMNYNFVDCDDYLENKYNKKISDCFLVSESYFRDLETVCLEELSKSNKNILSTGGGMVKRKENIDFFKDDIIIFINRPIENILSDIDKEDRPLINNKDSQKIIDIYNERITLYKNYCDIEVLNDGTLEEVIEGIAKKLANRI